MYFRIFIFVTCKRRNLGCCGAGECGCDGSNLGPWWACKWYSILRAWKAGGTIGIKTGAGDCMRDCLCSGQWRAFEKKFVDAWGTAGGGCWIYSGIGGLCLQRGTFKIFLSAEAGFVYRGVVAGCVAGAIARAGGFVCDSRQPRI